MRRWYASGLGLRLDQSQLRNPYGTSFDRRRPKQSLEPSKVPFQLDSPSEMGIGYR
jgi:hypothetical protein